MVILEVVVSMRILVVEDEYNLADVISSRLKQEKYVVDIEEDGEDAYLRALSNTYDLILLDVMLPSMDGLDILKKLREQEIQSKIILLTAKSTLQDKLNGFENGANDYLTKPFHLDELVARVNVQLKNDKPFHKQHIMEFGDLSLDCTKSKLTCIKTNETVDLVCKEFQLLEYFMKNAECILEKNQIYDKVWGIDNSMESNNLEAYLSFIRRKLKAIESNVVIKSVRGLGYKMGVKDETIKK